MTEATDERPKGLIVVRGQESIKVVEGTSQKAQPFVGASYPGECSELGIGLLLPEGQKIRFWGLWMPHHLIQAWRAMRILEAADVIDSGTLSHAWYAGGSDNPIHAKDVEELASQVTGFRNIRSRIFGEAPAPEELERMLTLLTDNDVSIDKREIEREIRAGILIPNPYIEKFIGIEAEPLMAKKEQPQAQTNTGSTDIFDFANA